MLWMTQLDCLNRVTGNSSFTDSLQSQNTYIEYHIYVSIYKMKGRKIQICTARKIRHLKYSAKFWSWHTKDFKEEGNLSQENIYSLFVRKIFKRKPGSRFPFWIPLLSFFSKKISFLAPSFVEIAFSKIPPSLHRLPIIFPKSPLAFGKITLLFSFLVSYQPRTNSQPPNDFSPSPNRNLNFK